MHERSPTADCARHMHRFHHAFLTFTPLKQVLRVRIDAIRTLNRVRHTESDQRLLAPGQRTILKDSTIPVEELLRQRLIPVGNVAKPLQVFRVIIGFHAGNIGTLGADMEQRTMKIGVIGAGAMGAGIAQVAAQAGHQVVLTDSSDEALARSESQLAKVMARLVEKGRLTAEAGATIQSRIKRSTDLADLAPCGLVIEAIVENLEVKQSVFRVVESHVSPDAILASNTSSLSITGIASALARPERFIGLHFFNPAPLLPLVEVIPALQTSPDLAATCVEWMSNWGKDPVVAKDTPGFIVNRVARPFYGEALRILEEGIADVPTIDAAMKDRGFRMGPFELMDLIGNDVNYAVTTTVFDAFYHDPRYRPSLVQKRHVEAGWLGRKAGRGYYDYAENAAHGSPSDDVYLREQVAERILAMLMNEAIDAVFMNIASSADIERAMTRGVNYPKGLLTWANEWGCDKAYGILENLRERYQEDRYRPSPLLRAHAASGTAIPV
jgi:3-hydroxybutyryl-CoA dehydrogenase